MSKKTKRRARNRQGQYLADDPSTPKINEAYVQDLSIIEQYNATIKKYRSLY